MFKKIVEEEDGNDGFWSFDSFSWLAWYEAIFFTIVEDNGVVI